MRYAMIMAGGVGSRLWPMSRQQHPKQLLRIIGGRCLLEIANDRLDGLVDPTHRYICINESLRNEVRQVLPDIADDRILGEPVGRNTMNAIGFSASVLYHLDNDATFIVLTADHVIEPQQTFLEKAALAFELIDDDPSRMVTFSIKPDFPATAYGYVERSTAIEEYPGAWRAAAFHEKPDEETAKQFVKDPNFGWNSGMFVYSAQTVLRAIEKYFPDAHAGLMKIGEVWNTYQRNAVLQQVYPTLPHESIDNGVMEKAANDDEFEVCTIPLDVQWTDIGSWRAYASLLQQDEDGCRTNANTVHLKSKNVTAISADPEHAIATIGCEDLIIVHTRDATLVCRADKDQDVKEIATMVEEHLQ